MGQATDQEIKDALERKGHYALNWEDLDKIEPVSYTHLTLPTKA